MSRVRSAKPTTDVAAGADRDQARAGRQAAAAGGRQPPRLGQHVDDAAHLGQLRLPLGRARRRGRRQPDGSGPLRCRRRSAERAACATGAGSGGRAAAQQQHQGRRRQRRRHQHERQHPQGARPLQRPRHRLGAHAPLDRGDEGRPVALGADPLHELPGEGRAVAGLPGQRRQLAVHALVPQHDLAQAVDPRPPPGPAPPPRGGRALPR